MSKKKKRPDQPPPSAIEKYGRKYKWAEKKKRRKCLYLLVTADKYRLPLAVADTMDELAEIAGVCPGTIYKCIHGGFKNSKYERVFIDEED